jgi:CTD small phosphatase-like protein 2
MLKDSSLRRISLRNAARTVLIDTNEHEAQPTKKPRRDLGGQEVRQVTGMNSPKTGKTFTFEGDDTHTQLKRSQSGSITQSKAEFRSTAKPEVLRPIEAKISENTTKSEPQYARSRKDVRRVVTSVKQRTTNTRSQALESLFQTFQAMKLVRRLPPCDEAQLQQKIQLLPKRQGYEDKKTIVFDLDETLVHCVEKPSEAQVPITVTFPNGDQVRAGINVRPYAREVLMAANQDFEVIVFTASHRCYADQVLNYLDPTGTLIHHRLYRESCVVTDSFYIKDLRVLGNRRLEDVVIVDNAVYSFAYQLENGVPIVSWYDDPNDQELVILADYLRTLAAAHDIRAVNRGTFSLHTFCEDYSRRMIKLGGKENWRFAC